MSAVNRASFSTSMDASGGTLRLSGRWVLSELEALEQQTRGRQAIPWTAIDGSAVDAIDSAGALLLCTRFLHPAGAEVSGLRESDLKLLQLVRTAPYQLIKLKPKASGIAPMLDRVGRALDDFFQQFVRLLSFTGEVLEVSARVLLGRQRLRWTATVHHMERAGLDAVPIVTLLSFLVGAVVAFLGATVLRDFGASVFTVELVSFSFLREFGVLLTAILLAGRSGSAFTAELGTMRAREEIDAIRALGLDPIELLVLPRMFALLLMLPILSFLGVIAGMLGGGLVGAFALDISPGQFLSRLQDAAELRHFLVGMVKAPVFAMVIALVGCLEGLKVRGSAESVGRHTTSAVVQSIFLVILLDALFAIFFMEMDL
jgi:phospholipid/cholesterol/gamma-HCH transport system permease protein